MLACLYTFPRRTGGDVLEIGDGDGDLDQEGVELALVPFIEELIILAAEAVLHDVVGLADKLHVAVLDACVVFFAAAIRVLGQGGHKQLL